MKMLRKTMTFAALCLVAVLGWIWLRSPSTPKNDVFEEGYYSLTPGYLGGKHYEFKDGRFRCLPFSDVGVDFPPMPGSYTINGKEVWLIYDNKKFWAETFQWRN